MSVFVCGVSKGLDKEFKCPLCDFESDDAEDFATSMCWDCLYNDEVWEENDEV